MQYLLRRKIVIISFMVYLFPLLGKSQIYNDLNLPDHDYRKFHFGIKLGTNRAFYRFNYNPLFMASDSIQVVESLQSSGINLAWLVNMRLGEHFDLRTYPLDLIFTEKALEYHLKYPNRFKGEDSIYTKKIQGITMAFPLQIKFSSDRINNLKVYLLAGAKVEYDFAANAGEKNADEQIKLNKLDYGVEAGIGFHFYFPVFVLSPELKISWGLQNLHSRDENLKYSNIIDDITSRTISFSLIIE